MPRKTPKKLPAKLFVVLLADCELPRGYEGAVVVCRTRSRAERWIGETHGRLLAEALENNETVSLGGIQQEYAYTIEETPTAG